MSRRRVKQAKQLENNKKSTQPQRRLQVRRLVIYGLLFDHYY
jgi:hypothetical protein